MIKRLLKSSALVFPPLFAFVFTLVFIGYLKPEFNLLLHLDNIQGEGTITISRSAPRGFSFLYETGINVYAEEVDIPFPGMHYDVKTLDFEVSDIDAMDVLSVGVYMFGHKVGEFSDWNTTGKDLTTENLIMTVKEDRVHFEFLKPGEVTTMSIDMPLIPAWFWVLYWGFILLVSIGSSLAVGYLALGHPRIVFPLYTGIAPLAVLLLGMMVHDSFPYIEYRFLFFNWLFLLSLCVLINALTLPWLGTVLGTGATLLWFFANYFVMLYRSKPIMPADLRAIGIAMEVTGGLNLLPTPKMALSVLIWLAYSAALIWLWLRGRRMEKAAEKTTEAAAEKAGKRSLRPALVRRGAAVLCSVVLMVLCVHNPVFSSLGTFAWDVHLLNNFHQEGMILTWLRSQLSSRLQAPEGYSPETANAFLADYQAQTDGENQPDGITPTNIIMVMNEAFSDLRDVGMNPDIDVMPYLDSLKENTLSGNLGVSVLGGGTCNTEFEALTGNTLAFLPPSVYPYTENVRGPMFSLASYFGGRDWYTAAFHSGTRNGWNRNQVYPFFGFNDYYCLEDYSGLGVQASGIHGYTTDLTDYAAIEAADAAHSGAPRFLFDVTIQNHAGYDRWMDLEPAEELPPEEELPVQEMRVYLSLIKLSDEALEQLVETYRNSDEPTMIVFFGDHQPSMPIKALPYLYGESASGLDAFLSKFFIWTNYETEAEEDVLISANFLPWLVLKRANCALPPYIKLLEAVHEAYPAITSQGVIDKDGTFYEGVDALPEDPLLQQYRYVQYANLTGELDPAWFAVDEAE